MRRKILLIATAVVLLAAGIAVAAVVRLSDRPSGGLDTDLQGVSVSTASDTAVEEETTTEASQSTSTGEDTGPKEPEEGPCWSEWGGNPQRTNSRPNIHLGRPVRPTVWARAMGGLMEYPPSFCDGRLYVNLDEGQTLAIDASTRKIVWSRKTGPLHASTPAIAGPVLIVSSHDGSVAGLRRSDGKELWRVQTQGKVESSPVAIDGTAYFASTDGRVFAVRARTGAIRWAFNVGGRMNSSPSIWGNRLFISTYTGAVFCLRRDNGQKLWSTYVKRDALRYESFYASASTDGARVYTTSRAGKVVAFSARTGRIVWTRQFGQYGYATPTLAYGRVFVGTYDGSMRALRATDGATIWSQGVGGGIHAAALVVGNLLFFTGGNKSYAVRVADGKVVWSYGVGQYGIGIATNRHYYFSLGGLLVAFRGEHSPKETTAASAG